jgi:hypothetical protein
MLREILPLIFEEPLTQAKARDYLEGWASLVKKSGLTCFESFLTTLDERLTAVCIRIAHSNRSAQTNL